MLQEQERANNLNMLNALRSKQADAEELTKILQRLPESERRIILNMVQGVLLIHNAEERKVC